MFAIIGRGRASGVALRNAVATVALFSEASARLDESPIDLLLLALNLHGRDGMELLASSVAGSFHTVIVSANTEQALLPPGFERIHKSYIVRLSAVKALHAQEGSHYEAELRNGLRLPVGRTRYRALRERLG